MKAPASIWRRLLRRMARCLASRCGLVAIPREVALEWTKEAGRCLTEAGKHDQTSPYTAGLNDGRARELHLCSRRLIEAGHA